MKPLTAIFGLSLALLMSSANGLIFDSLFAFPSTRRGRATPPASVASEVSAAADDEVILDSVSISKDADQSDDVIRALMANVLREAAMHHEEEPRPRPSALMSEDGLLFDESPIIQVAGNSNNGRPQMPRRVDEMKHFGEALDTDHDVLFHSGSEGGLPQLAASQAAAGGGGFARDDDISGEFLNNGAPDVMNLRSDAFLRQNDQATPIDDSDAAATADNAAVDAGNDDSSDDVDSASNDVSSSNDNNKDDSEMRCVPKVMQVEETVYDREIKCSHIFREKCHTSYITEYASSTVEKCEQTYKKNCHIIFKSMPSNETVSICHTPMVRKCGNESYGPDICSTQYESLCETVYTSYDVEQDEPVCRMEIMKKCQDVTIPLGSRRGRQFALSDVSDAANAVANAVASTASGDASNEEQNVVTVDQKCEEWPVQKCEVKKSKVKKVHPNTECKNVPRKVCVPNNCQMVKGDEICRDEQRVKIQKVPEEQCDLQPERNCHAEAVLVPRLVAKPACTKVPQETCVNQVTPRRVKKPVIKEWCYNPKDLDALKASNIVPSNFEEQDNATDNEEVPESRNSGNFFSRISRLLFNGRK